MPTTVRTREEKKKRPFSTCADSFKELASITSLYPHGINCAYSTQNNCVPTNSCISITTSLKMNVFISFLLEVACYLVRPHLQSCISSGALSTGKTWMDLLHRVQRRATKNGQRA